MDATPDTALPGLSWADAFALLDTTAQYWHRRHGRRIPLEEYRSAGNEGLTLGLQRYRPEGPASPQRTVEIYLAWAMRAVPRTYSPVGEAVYGTSPTPTAYRHTQTFPVDPHSPFWETLPPCAPHAETRTFAHELLADLATRIEACHMRTFVLRSQGWGVNELAAQHGHTTRWLQYHWCTIRQVCAQRKAVWEYITPEEVA